MPVSPFSGLLIFFLPSQRMTLCLPANVFISGRQALDTFRGRPPSKCQNLCIFLSPFASLFNCAVASLLTPFQGHSLLGDSPPPAHLLGSAELSNVPLDWIEPLAVFCGYGRSSPFFRCFHSLWCLLCPVYLRRAICPPFFSYLVFRARPKFIPSSFFSPSVVHLLKTLFRRQWSHLLSFRCLFGLMETFGRFLSFRPPALRNLHRLI